MIFAHFRNNFAAAFFPRLPEWAGACVIFALGWMLSANPDRMTTGSGFGYRIMLSMADQPTWSVVLSLFGFTRLVVLFINGAWRKSPWARAVMAFLSCFLWTSIVLSFAPTFGFAFIMACGWLGMEIVTITRAMRDARTVDDAYARGEVSGSK